MEPRFKTVLDRLEQLSAEVQELREGIRQSVTIADQDPEMSLTRARKVLEYIVRDLYQRLYMEPAGTRPLENLLQRLVKDEHFPKRLAAYANGIRELGNVGTHGFGEGVTTQDVYQSLTQLVPIVEWYFQRRGPQAPPPIAKPATNPSPEQGASALPATGPPSTSRRSGRWLVFTTLTAAVLALLGGVGLLLASNLLSPGKGEAKQDQKGGDLSASTEHGTPPVGGTRPASPGTSPGPRAAEPSPMSNPDKPAPPPPPAVVVALTRGLEDPDGPASRAAIDGLTKLKDASSAAALGRFVADAPWRGPRHGDPRVWPGSRADSDPALHDDALKLLQELAPSEAADALRTALKAKDSEVRLWALGKRIERQDDGVASDLVRALDDEFGPVRRAAIDGLKKRKESSTAPALARLVADSPWQGYRRGGPASVDFIGEANHDPKLRTDALDLLRSLAPDKAQEALAKASQSKDSEIRTWALEQLATAPKP